MDNFKSFNDFRRELHEGKIPEQKPREETEVTPEDPSQNIEAKEAPRVSRKKKRKGFRIRQSILLAGGGLLLAALGIFLLPLPLGYIHLTGTKALTMEDILFEGQIRQPVNVLQISASGLAERLSHDIRVAHVEVSRGFPFVLEVHIEDREPLAIMQAEYSYVVLDKEGMVIDSVQSIRKGDVAMITGKRMENLLLGDTVSQEDLDKALAFLNALSPEGQRFFSEINIGNSENIRAYTRDGITVRLGSGSDMEAQAKLAENMVGDVKARGLSVEYVDANLSSPFIKLKK